MKNSPGGRVLIVEDDLLLAMVEERLIENLGFEVIGKAQEGKKAIEQAAALKPDIIIMDISLKGDLNGIETVEIIRKSSNVAVIYLSGSSDRYYYERAKKTNFVAYLKKPVTRGELKAPLFKAAGLEVNEHEKSQLNKTA